MINDHLLPPPGGEPGTTNETIRLTNASDDPMPLPGPSIDGIRGHFEDSGDDFMARLQERIQAELQRTPRYRIVSTSGPAHALHFVVEVTLEGRVLGRGSGNNRKSAEQQAACVALETLETMRES